MPRRKNNPDGSVNKSAAVRDLLAQNSETPVKEIVATLAGQGVKVQASTVYYIKGQMKHRRRKQIGQSMAKAGIANPVDLILKVRSLAGEAGGLGKLKQLVDALAE